MMQIRLRAFDPFGDERGIIPEFVEVDYQAKLNALPTFTVKVAAGGVAEARLKIPVEIALEINTGSGWYEPPDCRFISTGTEYDPATPADVITVPCLGIGQALRWATVWDITKGNEDFKRVFSSSSPGLILHELLRAASDRRDKTGLAWARGALSWSFTPAADSARAAWTGKGSPEFLPSETLEKVTEWLTARGLIDYRFSGRTLEVYNADTILSRDNGVILRTDTAKSLPIREDYQELATVARFRGDSGFQAEKSAVDAYAGFGRVERWTEQGQTTTDATAALYLNELLAAGRTPKKEFRREWENTISGYTPLIWRDFLPGDWVTFQHNKLRIIEAGLKINSAGAISGYETLGTVIAGLLEKMTRGIENATTGAAGSDSGRPLPPGLDTRTPKAPAGLVATGETIAANGGYRGIVSLSWQKVTTATNNTPLEIQHYRYYTRTAGAKRLTASGDIHGGATACAFYARPGDHLEVRITAISDAGRESALSEPLAVYVNPDAVPPPRPAPLTLSQSLGVLAATWSGLDFEGNHMPPDFSRLEISVSTDAGAPLENSGAIIDAGGNIWLYPTPAPGVYYVAARAVDKAGNVSEWTRRESVEITALIDAPGLKDQISEAVKLIGVSTDQLERVKKELEQQINANAVELGKTGDKINEALGTLAETFSEAAINLIEISPWPPDSGTPNKSMWIAPDGRNFRLVPCSEIGEK